MIELPLVFIAGLLGTSHCVGMCGGFVAALGGAAPTLAANFRRQCVYSVGRIATYTLLGAMAGFVGWRFQTAATWLGHACAVLAVVAGLLLLWQGLAATGLLPRRVAGPLAGCPAATFFAGYLKAPGLSGAFLAGVFTGLLPCGLLYGMLALAASAASMAGGAAVMAVFGAGTVPVMVLVGAGAAATRLFARHVYRVAGCLVALTGLIAIARGLGFLELTPWLAPPGCPFCG